MKSFKKHTIRFRRSNGRRGSVIVLVVATLALLAVIGTVYIVSARSERVGAQAATAAVNMDLAQQSVNDVAAQAIGEQMYDAMGILGGVNGGINGGGVAFHGPFGGTPGGFVGGAARTYDMPEFNVSNRAAKGIRDQSWLVANLYRPVYPKPMGTEGYEGYEDSPHFRNNIPYFNDMTMPQNLGVLKVGPTTYISPAVFDPSTGGYSILVYANTAMGWTYPYPYTLLDEIRDPVLRLGVNQGMFRVVPDPSMGPPTIAYPDNNPGHPSGGPSGPDAIVQMLPFSEASGVRYRFGLRIIDTSRMANLNVGMTYPDGAWTTDAYEGRFLNGYNLADSRIFDSRLDYFTNGGGTDAWQTIGGSDTLRNPARAGAVNVLNEQHWSAAILRLDCPQAWGLAPFDLSDELGLRSYGTLGTMSAPRPASRAIWPNNLGTRIVNTSKNPEYNFHRGNYTSYSYSRDLRAGTMLDPVDNTGASTAFILQKDAPGGGVGIPVLDSATSLPVFPGQKEVWQPYPAPVGVGVDVSRTTGMTDEHAANILAATATNIATAMRKLPTPQYELHEATAFAANYLTYRWADWDTFTCFVNGTEVKAWSLVNGPSFIDDLGICIRNKTYRPEYGRGESRDLASGTSSLTVLGYAAQPFINEIIVTETGTTNSDGVTTTTTDDFAVELYNPYNVSLSLEGYKLVVLSTTDTGPTSTNTYDLSADRDTPKCVPARGYFVFAKGGGKMQGLVTESVKLMNGSSEYTGTVLMGTQKEGEPGFTIVASALEPNTSKKILLMRPYMKRGGTIALAAVDQFDISGFNVLKEDGTHNYTLRRANNEKPADDPAFANWLNRWKAAVSFKDPQTPTQLQDQEIATSLGFANPDSGSIQGVPLYSRVAMDPRLPFENIGDFNSIMRIAHRIDNAGLPVIEGGLPKTIGDQLVPIAAEGSDNATDSIARDGKIHFNFDEDGPARQMLNCFSMVDRVTDYTINLGDNDANHRGISKLRIPGKININTASPEVLLSIPFFKSHPDVLSVVLARRWCTTNADPSADNRFPGGYAWGLRAHDPIPTTPPREVPAASSVGKTYGFHSMWELKEYMNVTDAWTIADRDQNWARVYNYLTTRSDTFVVYAYLEAVRQNPRYTENPSAGRPHFDNALHWYTTNYDPSASGIGISEYPNDTTHALQLMGRRRWVAIVDRSYADFNRTYLDYSLLPLPPQYKAEPFFAMPRVVAQKDLPR